MEGLFDIHSHILPSVDDGAKDLEESLGLLELSKKGNVGCVVATPHFHAESVFFEDYIKHVDTQLDSLRKQTTGIEIIKGFEVRYFKGISKVDRVRLLTLGGSDYLLMEFPYNTPITEKCIKDVEDVYYNFGITPVLAHIERYTKYKGFDMALGLISDGLAIAHINAASMFDGYKNAALSLIETSHATLIASDTHSLRSRPPLMSSALKVISEELGRDTESRIINNLHNLYEQIVKEK